jgi:nitrogen-specific signal transduction histidine kinase
MVEKSQSEHASPGGLSGIPPPAAAEDSDILSKFNYFQSNALLKKTIDSIPDTVLILDKSRRIVFANQTAVSFFKITGPADIRGRRPGEAFKCFHSSRGCGADAFCAHCGALNAFAEAGAEVIRHAYDWRLTRGQHHDEISEFRIWVTPITENNEKFVILAIQDISREKRKRMFERIFFHDILNIAGGLHGFTELLTECPGDTELVSLLKESASRLLEEITCQKLLIAAENHELTVIPVKVHSSEIIAEAVSLCENRNFTAGKKILEKTGAGDIELTADRAILRRVLFNMLRSVFESTPSGGAVSIGAESQDNKIKFTAAGSASVTGCELSHRTNFAKNEGRGLNLYSIRLMTEKYLNGKVSHNNSFAGGPHSIEITLPPV